MYKWPARRFVFHHFYTGKSPRENALIMAQKWYSLLCLGVCNISKALLLLIQALYVLRGLAGKAVGQILPGTDLALSLYHRKLSCVPFCYRVRMISPHLSWIYYWQVENEKRPSLARRYITWSVTTATILASKLIKFTSVQLSPVDKPRSANPINHCLTHLPDLSLKLEKKLIISSPFQFCAPQPEDLFKS